MRTMRYGARAALLCCLFCLSSVVSAQQLPLRYYTQTDGLENLAVNTLAQDPRGFLWIGTENGLYRYDGTQFRRFGRDEGLPSPYVTALHVDANGRVWVGTERGLHLLQDRMMPLLQEGRPLPIWRGSVLASTDDGRLLAVSNGLLVEARTADGGKSWRTANVFDQAQRNVHPQLRQIVSVHISPGGELWMGCGQTLCRYGRNGLAVLDASHGVPKGGWDVLAQDSEGTLWARSEKHVIALPASAAKAPRIAFLGRTPTPTAGDGAVALNYNSLAPDADGRILTGTDTGIARWNGQAWDAFGPANGLKVGGGINAILADRDGELWLGTLGYGLARWLGYPVWENWTVQDGLPGTGVWSIHRDSRGALRIGTKSGVGEWQDGLRRFTAEQAAHEGATHQRSSVVEDAGGNLWSGTFSGFLIRRDAATGQRAVVAQLPAISRLLVDRKERLWIATIQGLYLVERPGRDTTPLRVTALDAMTNRDEMGVHNICEGAAGKLWFATEGGLLGFDGERWRRLPLASAPKPFPFYAIACSAEDDTVWLGGHDAGIWRVRTGAPAPDAENATPPSLGHKLVFALHLDSRGWLWTATDYGVAVWNRAQWRVFDQQSGLVWNDCNDALYEDRDGSVWIGTSNGVSRVLKPERLFADARMDLVIESIARDERVLPADAPLALSWGPGSLQIEMAAPSYRNRESLVYRYRMAGLEDAWSTTRSPVLHYPPLPPGDYRLQIVAENPAQQTTSDVVEFDLKIQPMWWQSRLFHLACVLAVLLTILWAHRYRLRRMVAHQQTLERLILDRTHELEASREALRALASQDGLTDALNRRALMEVLNKGLAQSRRSRIPLTLMLVDLDHFKQINDAHGHPTGDAVLKELVRRFAGMVRAYDSIGRFGGEEFALVLPGFDGRTGCDRIVQLQQAIGAEAVRTDQGEAIVVTCSAGVAIAEGGDAITADGLIAQADAALYRAKALGRNRVEYAPASAPASPAGTEDTPALLESCVGD